MIPLILLAATTLSLATASAAECTRAMLQLATAAYVKAQTAGSPAMASLTTNASYSENDHAMDVTKGVLAQPLKIDFTRSIHDPVLCATFTEIIAATAAHPYVIGTRMLLGAADGRIHTVESVVTDDGDWAFNATGYAYWNGLETWDPIPAGQRDSRAVIQAAGDAYFDRWNDVAVVIPLGTPCARLEGGAYTGRGNLSANTCNLGGFPSTIKVTNRRYVVDEEMGVVDIFMGFPGLERTQPTHAMPDSHMFRVEGGLVRYIHTVSACETSHCGMNGTGPPL